MKEFTKQDLKDGMVLTYDGGDKRLLMGGHLYINENNKVFNWAHVLLSHYKDDLTHINTKALNIAKVEYMGEILWERKEYVTFDEARKSGKKIRYCGDWDGAYTLRNINDFMPAHYYVHTIVGGCSLADMNRILDDPKWEVKQ